MLQIATMDKLFTHASVTKQYNLVPVNGRWCSAAGEVTAGLAESNGSLLPGLWLWSRAGWLPTTGINSRTIRSFRVWEYLYLLSIICKKQLKSPFFRSRGYVLVVFVRFMLDFDHQAHFEVYGLSYRLTYCWPCGRVVKCRPRDREFESQPRLLRTKAHSAFGPSGVS